MNKAPALKRLYTVYEAAIYLGIAHGGVRRLIDASKIPYIQRGKGGKILLDIKDLDKFIDQEKRVNPI